VQGIELELDEHKRVDTMFQHAVEYNVQITNILFSLSDLEIKNKQIIKKKKDMFKICKELWRRYRSSK
jgi:hypothetical protein